MRHTKKPSKSFRSGDTGGKFTKRAFGKSDKPAGFEKRFYNTPVKRNGVTGSSERSENASSASEASKFSKPRLGKSGSSKPSFTKQSERNDSDKKYRPEKKFSSAKKYMSEKAYSSEKKYAGEKTYASDRPVYSKKPFGKKPFPNSQNDQNRTRSIAPVARRADAWQAPEKTHSESIFLWGVHAVRAAWLNPQRRCYRLWVTEAGQEAFATFGKEAKEQLLKRPDPKNVDRATIDKLLPPGSVHQGIVLEAAPLHQAILADFISANPPPDLLLILDQVTDPHNVGAILRSAVSLGASGVIMTERNSPDTTGVLAKTASGAVDHIPIINVVNLSRALDELHEAGYWSVGLAEEGAKDLAELDLTGRTVLVLGAEGPGLRQLTRKKCHELARLPTQGPIGSLNVSNAAAIALYEVKRQRKA